MKPKAKKSLNFVDVLDLPKGLSKEDFLKLSKEEQQKIASQNTKGVRFY